MRKTFFLGLLGLFAGCGKNNVETVSMPSPSSNPVASAPTVNAPPEAKPNKDPLAVACDGGELPSCIKYADGLLRGDDKNAKAGCEYPLRKACDGNVGRACSDLASRCLPVVSLTEGRKTYLKDKTERASLNEKACGLGDGLGCFNIAKLYEEGEGVDRDEAKASTLMKKALTLIPKDCEKGDGQSCFSLAMLYNPDSASTVVTKDRSKSTAYYKKACDVGQDMGCNVLKAMAK